MKILLDGKDLINIVEHSIPISVGDFRQRLESKGGKLVLSYMNVRELAAPIAMTGEVLRIRALLHKLEELPVCYIREGFIQRDEVKSGLAGFNNGKEYSSIDPFVRRWDYTFFDGESAAKDYINYSLFDIVYDLSQQNPSILLYPKKFGAELRRRFSVERQMPRGVKKTPSANFPDAVGGHITQWGLPAPTKGLRDFAKWIYSDPAMCPGFRLSYEMYHAVQANLTDIPKDGDIPDFAYVPALPYVDYLTLDRRMYGYALGVTRSLSKLNPTLSYQKRLFRSAHELLKVL